MSFLTCEKLVFVIGSFTERLKSLCLLIVNFSGLNVIKPVDLCKSGKK